MKFNKLCVILISSLLVISIYEVHADDEGEDDYQLPISFETWNSVYEQNPNLNLPFLLCTTDDIDPISNQYLPPNISTSQPLVFIPWSGGFVPPQSTLLLLEMIFGQGNAVAGSEDHDRQVSQ